MNRPQVIQRVVNDLNNYVSAYDAFLWAVENGLMKGDPELYAQDYALGFAQSRTKEAFAAATKGLK